MSADKPHQKKREPVGATVGGGRGDYPGATSSKTLNLVTVKLLLISTISTPGACWQLPGIFYSINYQNPPRIH
jgi:hypothetical protein